jgi:hypothetical protein
MKKLRNLIGALVLAGAGEAQAGGRVELDVTNNETVVDTKIYGKLGEHLGYFARDFESYNPEEGASRITLGQLSYDLNFGGALIAGMSGTDPIVGMQYGREVLGTNCFIWGGSTLEKDPSFSGLLTLGRVGEKGLTLEAELVGVFSKEGYQLSKERLRLGYTNEEGVGVGLAGNLMQTRDSHEESFGIYLRLTQ